MTRGARLALAAAILGVSSSSAAPDGPPPVEAERGLACEIEVAWAGSPLRARANQSAHSPLVVRVIAATVPGRHRVVFVGLVAGTYDLRDRLEHEDGTSAADLPPLPVRVVSRLAPGHGTDLHGLDAPSFAPRTRYQKIMALAALAWIAVPLVALVRRARRRPPPPPPAAPATPPPNELGRLVGLAHDRPLTVDERGRLELLVLHRLHADVASEVPGADPATVLRTLRAHPRTRDVVAAVERWLHARSSPGAVPEPATTAILDELARTCPDAPDPVERAR